MKWGDGLELVKFENEDLELFEKWLNDPFIYRWFCDGGEEDIEAWLEDVGSGGHSYSFIAVKDGVKMGFGVCLDLFYEPEYVSEQYPDLNLEPKQAFEINYLIDEKYLGQGLGKEIVRLLERKCKNMGAKWVMADPSEQNVQSTKVLLANGFKKYKDGDYRKEIIVK